MNSIAINTFKKDKELNEIEELLDDFSLKFGEYKVLSDLDKKVLDGLNNLVQEERKIHEKGEEKLYDFFKEHLRKFYYMTVMKYVCGSLYVKSKYAIFPCSISPSNKYLSCIKSYNLLSKDNGRYVAGIDSNGIMLEDFAEKDCEIILEEISKDEFIKSITSSVENVVKYRLEND